MTQIRIPRFLGAISWITALLVFMLPPALYYMRESAALHSEMEASLEVQTHAIMRVINSSPETWRFQDNLLSVLLAFDRHKPGSERITRIVEEKGDLIIASGPMPSSPHYAARQALFDSGKTVGQVEQITSLRPMLLATALLTLISAVAGLFFFLILKRIPLRAIENAIREAQSAAASAQIALDEQRAAEAQLHAANATLNRQARIDTLLGRLAEVANATRSLPEALSDCLRLICEYTGWAIGHAALVRRDGNFAVAYLDVWHSGAMERYANFVKDNEQYRFPLKVGSFATRVLSTGRPVWDKELAARSGFGRLGFLKQAGLVSGIALPMPVTDDLPGLIEFFTEQAAEPDPELLTALERACVFIGRIVERQKSAEEIRRLNVELEERIAIRTAELEKSNQVLALRNHEASQITEMSNLLQTATDMNEAAEILTRMMGRLLAPHGGAIYLTASSQNRLDCLTAWGVSTQSTVIGPDECWGVRRARSYWATDPRIDMFCTHVPTEGGLKPYMCVPMMSQSTALGMLHVEFSAETVPAEVHDNERQRVQRLADQVAMALANLKLRQSLREQSIRDTLTGLYNRRYLEESLERELARAERETVPLAVYMIDVDHFKRYNDLYGHEGGDAVLHALGRLLRDMMRGSDVAARYGGEEFTALLYNATLDGACNWGERLREAVQKMEVKSNGQHLPPITISVGLAMYPEHRNSKETLLQAADAALYEAKRSGRDRLVIAGRGDVDVEPRAAAQGVVVALPRLTG